MSEFKERVLAELTFAMLDDIPDLQKVYDRILAMEVQPTSIALNHHQQILLDHLKNQCLTYGKLGWFGFDVISKVVRDWYAIPDEAVALGFPDMPDYLDAYGELDNPEQFQVLIAFAQWALKEVEG